MICFTSSVAILLCQNAPLGRATSIAPCDYVSPWILPLFGILSQACPAFAEGTLLMEMTYSLPFRTFGHPTAIAAPLATDLLYKGCPPKVHRT